MPDCIRSWSQKKVVEIKSPNSTRPWQHVLEPLSGYLNLGEKLFNNIHLSGEGFNFGPSSVNTYTVEEVIKGLVKFWGFKNNLGGYKIIENTSFHEAGLLKLNCDKSLHHLGWFPVLDFDKVIEFTGRWYFEFYKNSSNMFDYTLEQLNKYEDYATAKSIKWTK